MRKLSGSLDANAILRLVLNDIPAQTAGVAALVSNPQCTYAVADVAVVEVEYVLRTYYGFSREHIKDTLGALLLHPSVQTNVTLMKSAFTMYIAHPRLSFTDCCLAAHAEADGARPLWTFDQKLAKQSSGTARLIGG